MESIKIIFRPFLYTPRSGSKIVAVSKSAVPFVTTLEEKAAGSHVLSGAWVQLILRKEGRGDERQGWNANAKAFLPLINVPVVAVDERGELVLFLKQDMSSFNGRIDVVGQMAIGALINPFILDSSYTEINIVSVLLEQIAPLVEREIAKSSEAIVELSCDDAATTIPQS